MATSQRYTALIPPNHLGSLGYEKFNIFKDQELGRGSYGTVYKAVYDDLPCAAKVLHPTLVDGRMGGIVERFEQECQVLSRIKHPNIVLYLGLRTDPVTQLPVLLMELLDESLTKMLLRSHNSLAYFVQVELGHNITLALSYLHSHNIIHRDLSGNNVLITASRIAKVTDFGMSCITNHTECSKLTCCPGTECYMAPESFNDHPVYTKSLDVFSFGVIMIQILTRLVPHPGPRTREVSQLHPKGRYQMIVPEHERRQDHISLVQPPNHPLLKTALDCIRDNPSKRPAASNLCRMFQELKTSPAFTENKKQRNGGGDRLCVGDTCSVSNGLTSESTRLKERQDRDGEISSLHQQLREQETFLRAQQADMKRKLAALNEFADKAQHLREVNQKLTAQLKLKEGELQQKSYALESMKGTCRLQVEERNKAVRASKQEIAHRQEMNRSTSDEKRRDSYEKDELLSARESQIVSLNKKLHESERRIEDYQTTVYNLQEKLKELQLQQKRGSPVNVSKAVQLKYQCSAPMSISRGAAVVHNSIAYFTFRGSVLTYNIHSCAWNKMAECPQANGGFAAVGELPTMIGGEKGGQVTGELVSLVDGFWMETFPRMPTPRIYSSAITHDNYLIVVGGSSSTKLGIDILPVVEVMDISNYQTEQAWSSLTSLPHPLACTSVAIHKGHMILHGGMDRIGKTLINLTCDISSLLNSNKRSTRNAKGPKAIGIKLKRALDPTSKREREITPPPLWLRLGHSRKYHSTCVSIGGQLLAVGGHGDYDEADTTVDRYNTNSSSWEQIGSMGSARWLCHAVGLSDNDLIVVGGLQKHTCEANALTNDVEILTIDNHSDYVCVA